MRAGSDQGSPLNLEAVVAELQALLGARVQRVDEVDVHVLAISLRTPGHTWVLLLSAQPGLARLHLVPDRPARAVSATGLQSAARRRLLGRPLSRVALDEKAILLGVPGTLLEVPLDGRRGMSLIDAELGPPSRSGDVPDRFPANEALAASVGQAADEDRRARRVRALSAPLVARRKKLRRRLGRLDEDGARLRAMADRRADGELLKPLVRTLTRGVDRAEAMDWQIGEPRQIRLDPRRSPHENLERIFAQAKKGERGLPMVEARRTATETELAEVEAELARIRRASLEDLDTAPTREPASSRPGQPAKPSALDRVARRFVSVDGVEIRVGKGAAANDRLSFGFARGHHVWLHARGVPGAHVLLRLDRGRPLSQEALLDGAHLAVHYSDARGEGGAEVIYTEARHLKKVKGAPGQVRLSKEKTVWLRVEPERLRRLLGG